MDLISLLIPAALAVDLNRSVPAVPSDVCLIDNILHEARGEPVEGQLAVLEVVFTRALRSDFPDTLCEVVNQPYQFSWTNPGAVKGRITESEWTLAARVVYTYIYSEDLPESPVAGATHYLNPDKVDKLPQWYYEYTYVGTVGNHEFFKRPEFPWVTIADNVRY